MFEVKIIKMTKEEYMSKFGVAYDNGELFDYPKDEINYILNDTDIKELALIDDRLYELA